MNEFIDMTSLGVLALVIVLASAFGNRLMSLLNAHLEAVQAMDTHQTLLLEACLQKLTVIQESVQRDS